MSFVQIEIAPGQNASLYAAGDAILLGFDSPGGKFMTFTAHLDARTARQIANQMLCAADEIDPPAPLVPKPDPACDPAPLDLDMQSAAEPEPICEPAPIWPDKDVPF